MAADVIIISASGIYMNGHSDFIAIIAMKKPIALDPASPIIRILGLALYHW
jgi:hypothetical protein